MVALTAQENNGRERLERGYVLSRRSSTDSKPWKIAGTWFGLDLQIWYIEHFFLGKVMIAT